MREARLARPRAGPAADDRRRRGACGAERGTAGTRRAASPPAAGPRPSGCASPRAPPRASSGGRSPGSRRASIVLPVPGGPASSRLCRPAAAISSARRARSWPRTSPRSGCGTAMPRASAATGSGSSAPRRYDAASARWRIGIALDAGERGLGGGLGRAHEPRRARPGAPPRRPRARRAPAGPGRRARAPRAPRARAGTPRRNLLRRRQHGERDRQVEAGALLAERRPARG